MSKTELKAALETLTRLEHAVIERPRRSKKEWEATWKELQGVRARVVELGG